MNAALESRLYNFKFVSATLHLEGEPKRVVETVKALAHTFGDVGWFEGEMGRIVNAALLGLGVDMEADEPQKEEKP